MQYEIRAYDALYDAKTKRIAYWDVCSDERHKTVETVTMPLTNLSIA